jgi:hypothetical protein
MFTAVTDVRGAPLRHGQVVDELTVERREGAEVRNR